MNKNIFTSIASLIGFCILFSCEEQMVMIPEFEPPVSERVVLIEELTGVNCPNCPAGSAKLDELQSLFGDNLAVYGIHGTNQTEPVAGTTYDFRNQDNIDLEFYLDFLGKPSAVVNRVRFPGQNFWAVTTIDLWQSLIEQQFEKELLMNLFLDVEYNDQTRAIDLVVNGVALADLPDNLKLTVVLTESGIIDSQSDQGQIIPDYQHDHVLREIISSSVSGDLVASNLSENDAITKNYTYTVPTEDGLWNVDKMEIIAYVTHFTNGTEEVLQAARYHF